jgi:hypothetical protein
LPICALQKLFGVQMATFRPKVLAYWTSGQYTDLEQDGSGDEGDDE